MQAVRSLRFPVNTSPATGLTKSCTCGYPPGLGGWKKHFNGNHDRVLLKSQCDSCCHHTEVVRTIMLFVQQGEAKKVQVAKVIII